MSKCKSKRIPTRKREKINKKVREHFKKQRKLQRKKVKIPKSVFLTKDEKAELENIKKNENIRNEILKNKKEEKEALYLNFDVFIFVLDYRDIEQSRSLELEEYLKSKNKSFYYYINFIENNIDINNYINSNLLDLVINDKLNTLSSKKTLLIGNAKVGKFLIQKEIEANNKEIFVKRHKTKTATSASSVFRNSISIEKVDVLQIMKEIFVFINPAEIKAFYKLPDFETLEEFLTEVGNREKHEERRKRKIMEKGAQRLITDIKENKIHWIYFQGKYEFKI